MVKFLKEVLVGTGAAGFVETKDGDFSSVYGITKASGIDLRSYPCRGEW